jgi:hypothetical protein
MKAHSVANNTFNLIRSGGIKVVCSVRRPEDAIASWMEAFNFGLDESIGHMTGWIESFERIRPYALVLRYEEIDRHPWRAVDRIAKHLCDDVSFAEVRQIAQLYAKDRVKLMADSLTLVDHGFHRRHISSLVSRPAVERIGSDSVSRIRDRLGRLVGPDGYLTMAPAAPRTGLLDSILSLASV